MGTGVPPKGPLFVVVLSQFLAMGLWFSGTAVVQELQTLWGLSDAQAGALTSLTVLGFVAGTLVFAVLNLSDRFPPQHVFLVSALTGALAMVLFVYKPGGINGAFALRFLTGFALAGVYPVGMKILASWYDRLGWAIGLLVAALTLGSGSPYLVRASGIPWQGVVFTSSALAVLGGILVAWRVRPGPRLPGRSRFLPSAFARAFKVRGFRRSALGYFGHMWELYALWGLLPLFLAARGDLSATQVAAITFAAFLAGAIACVWAGHRSKSIGEARVARTALIISGLLCVLSPLLFMAPVPLLVVLVLVWGAAVIADSAQFSALSAHAAPQEHVGTALTIQNAIGFGITFAPLTLVPVAAHFWGWQWAFLLLAIGPMFGAWSVSGLVQKPVPKPVAAPV